MAESIAPAPAEVVIRPNVGPQSEAFRSSATITIYGGAAGGGKTWLTLLRMGIHAQRYPGYYGVVFRRKMAQVTQGGGLWEESAGIYPLLGARRHGSLFQWRFPHRSLVQFRGLQHQQDVEQYMGSQFAEIAFEELTHFEESQFWYMVSRLRTKCGMQARMLATCNPDPDSFVRRLIDWWIDPVLGTPIPERAGVKRYFLREGDTLVWGNSAEELRAAYPHLHKQKPQSLRFIPARLSDNPTGDPDYESKLSALSLVDRERLLGGNWNVRAVAGSYFKRTYFTVLEHAPGNIKRIVRGWDLAATEPSKDNADPDWTVGVKVAELDNGDWCVLHAERLRKSPGGVQDAIKATAKLDGTRVLQAFWRDPGQAGVAQVNAITTLLAGHVVKFHVASKNKQAYASPVSSWAEHSRIKVVRGPWLEPFLATLEGFPTAPHDDDVDGLSRASIELFPQAPNYDPAFDQYLPKLRM